MRERKPKPPTLRGAQRLEFGGGMGEISPEQTEVATLIVDLFDAAKFGRIFAAPFLLYRCNIDLTGAAIDRGSSAFSGVAVRVKFASVNARCFSGTFAGI